MKNIYKVLFIVGLVVIPGACMVYATICAARMIAPKEVNHVA